ncbi:uncharacterized protein E0L32_011215 [Thyridium curvatum]|uniref:DUF8021 domain-containing protein n=1 Tax=Thyridium curvatum TaxID=1093900 RepID=A0A507B9X9_9PEZI|nr:uncharacterized protein E0L32_011215 [Thyridium curvatum]TPX19142.1 hypothetical protein E0L32_011215 [Thyridium curvatum]
MRPPTSALALAAFLSPATVTAACNRDLLQQSANEFIQALSMGMADHMQNIATQGFTYLENNKPTDIKAGVVSKSPHVAFNRTLADMQVCATFTEMVAPGPEKPYLIHAQIRHNASEESNAVYLIDAIVATTGSFKGFNASETMRLAEEEDWGFVPQDTWDTRATLVAAGAMYLDLVETQNPFGRVAMGDPCQVLDGSQYGNCTSVGATELTYSSRRSVVDESVDAINVFALGERKDGSMAMESVTLRLGVERVRYVHSLSVPIEAS